MTLVSNLLEVGCDMPLAFSIEKCECGRLIDKETFRRLICKSGGGHIWSYESLASVWCDCIRALGMTYLREPVP